MAKKKVASKKAPAKKKAAAVKRKFSAKPKKPSVGKATAKKKAAPAKRSRPKAAASQKAPARKAAKKKMAAGKTPPKKTTKRKVTPEKATAGKTTKRKAPAKKEAAARKALPGRKKGRKAPIKKASKKVVRKSPVKKRIIAAKKRPLLRTPKVSSPLLSKRMTKTGKPKKLPAAFLRKQKQKLLDLHDSLIYQMNDITRDTLTSSADGGDSSAFGMHQADAGTDAYDREFALNLLSQEQDALYEIEQALERIKNGSYGICEGSGEPIPRARLEAMPFARCTVAFQEKLDQDKSVGIRRTPTGSLFESGKDLSNR